jgi:hypothetical protein
MKYHERYGILYTQRFRVGRKLVCMDLKKGRILYFHQDELNGEEIETELKDFILSNMERLNSGYWDYTGDPGPKVTSLIESLEQEKKESSIR